MKAITAFKVIQGHRVRYQSLYVPVCDFLLVINSNWHPISYRFGVIAAYCSNFPPTRSLWLKLLRRSGRPPPIIFAPIVRPMNAFTNLSLTVFTRVTAEALRAKIDRKLAISHQRGHFDPKFQVQGVAPTNIFARLVRPMNALQLCLWQFSHKETL